MRPHESLDVWNKAVDFVVSVYQITEPFPKEEKFGLTSQLRRAAVSVPANIAEGAARELRRSGWPRAGCACDDALLEGPDDAPDI